MKDFIRGYGIEWIALHTVWAAVLCYWFYSLYGLHQSINQMQHLAH